MAGSPHDSVATAPAVVGGIRAPNPPVASPSPGNVRALPSYPMPGYLPPPAGQVPGPRYSAPPFAPAPRPAMFPRPPPIAAGSPARPPVGGMRPLPVLKPPGMPDMSAKPIFGAGPYEKPFTTVYVGKIAPTIEDAFLRNVLQLCGPIKSWKRAQDPTASAPKGFGFCEFENAEGVLRALRLLNKNSLDGQELVLNVNKDTREYLERYVAAKENDKLLEEAAQEEDSETAPGVEVQPSKKPVKSADGNPKAFGIVNEADKKGDEDALIRLKHLLEDRARSRPLFRPHADGRPPSTRDASAKSKDADVKDDLSGKNDDENSSDRVERMETSSSERGRKDKDHRERENDRDVERFERDRERERFRRDRDRNAKHRDIDRAYEEHEREWEARERERDRQRLHDKEREKERERERKKEVKEQEDDSDDEGKKRRYRPEERRRRRMREKEEDIADAIREQEELLEAKRRKVELEMQDALRAAKEAAEASKEDVTMEIDSENEDGPANDDYEATAGESAKSDQEMKNIPKKLGFGISGTGKRATLPSLFHQEDEEEMPKDRMLRPLVPIDYSAEEMQAVKTKRSPSAEDDRKDRRHRDKSRKDRDRDRDRDENSKIMDAKQLIDSIPKTKEELFNYRVDWAIYDKHKLHEKMRPWISKKITEYLGEEEVSFVDFIVNNTCKHVSAESMLEKLSVLDDEAEMFVLKMWRMLIFEIRRIETGLAKPNS
ncbi:RNA-binding protein 25 isoform X1 [Selaginella moellendorffii]|uniref:RNA-binding protein 25 isoform X1 n=2 Tax=Selaginella moellendorffii TaxID=88036 RepID=UPI000D1C5FB8|nr:RNA-binding protein 25 isoform X1 [Selaginella moellendorffii]XP_024530283.1 RNA-binding protein 25 isoform X1 [Selaginella moellendorffii]XP_024530284.1 RNA-binding protein 25 isoform X1 [Selaginella moellendorffii]XP_024530286.1 RNA-binding protein 25 isoform X1 [Selaginella moellendorffii]XP_024530287.1 RNA-binding protein 25 isoform X1 [Selaginella moellendorffii]|eukprot:XP_024530282.1 RNA-binding protein 25 isoform X1 [Selaginella moellendorffii]